MKLKLKRNWKKAGLALLLAILAPGRAWASGLAVGVNGFYFRPTGQAFEQVYGSGSGIGAEAFIRLWKNLDLWIGADYFEKKGELTFTREKTTVRILPLKAGLRLRLPAGRLTFHAGAALGYFFFEEKNPIGEAEEAKMGFLGKAGCSVRIVKGLYVDGWFRYTHCSIRPFEVEADIGGMSLGLGIGYDFGLEKKKEEDWKWEEVRTPCRSN